MLSGDLNNLLKIFAKDKEDKLPKDDLGCYGLFLFNQGEKILI